jgi:hypothetical protein
MAEVAAGLYAAETVVEGAAIGAFAVSRPTAPLHLKFRRIPSPADRPELLRSNHTLNIVKGKAYIIGGRVSGAIETETTTTSNIIAITLPVASSIDGEGDLTPPDYEVITPELREAGRPLAPRQEATEAKDVALHFSKIGHTTTTVGGKLYIWGGQLASSNEPDVSLTQAFVVFDPLTSSYSLLEVDATSCINGSPQARRSHSATCGTEQSPHAGQGKIFIHGGETPNGQKLRDCWEFSIEQRVWRRLPDVPEPSAGEVANEGRLAFVNGLLWRVGDGFGRATYLDLCDSSKPNASQKEWQVISFGTEITDEASTAPPSALDASSLPLPRLGATTLHVSTGSGRSYLLYFMGWELQGVLNDFWSFQIPSEEKTASSLKDTIRDAVAAKTKKSWSSGKHTWARCEIENNTTINVNKRKEKDRIDTSIWLDGEHLQEFAADVWVDQGRNVFIIWGGTEAACGKAVDGGWIVTVK